MKNDMTIEQALEILKKSEDYKILTRISLDYMNDNPELPYSLYIDTETTGLNYQNDKIISLSFMKIFHEDNVIIGFGKPVTYYNDPGIPIPEEITKLTHITDDMVRNQSIPINDLEGIITGAEFLIAHHAEFDRNFLENIMPYIRQTTWGCSFKDIPWKEMGFSNSKLEFIANQSDVFYQAHSSESDIVAGTYLITHNQYNNKSGFELILDACNQNKYLIKAFNTPFASKDKLKEMGCYWIPEEKTWAILIEENKYDETKKSLLDIYNQFKSNPNNCKTYKISPQERFSSFQNYQEAKLTFSPNDRVLIPQNV